MVSWTELRANVNFALNCGKMLRKLFKYGKCLFRADNEKNTSTEPVYKIKIGTTSVEFAERSECVSTHKIGEKEDLMKELVFQKTTINKLLIHRKFYDCQRSALSKSNWTCLGLPSISFSHARWWLQFLAKKKITAFLHPSYSPNTVPCDFYLLPKFKLL